MTYEKFLQLSDSIDDDVTIAELEAMSLPEEIDLDDDVELLEFEDISEEDLDALELANTICDVYKSMSDFYKAAAEGGIRLDNGLNADYEAIRTMIEERDRRIN